MTDNLSLIDRTDPLIDKFHGVEQVLHTDGNFYWKCQTVCDIIRQHESECLTSGAPEEGKVVPSVASAASLVGDKSAAMNEAHQSGEMLDNRKCTCHPSEAPEKCQKQYAYSDCAVAKTAQEIIEYIWSGWYGKHRGNMNVDQMGALLSGAKAKIINAMRLSERESSPCKHEMEYLGGKNGEWFRCRKCGHRSDNRIEG